MHWRDSVGDVALHIAYQVDYVAECFCFHVLSDLYAAGRANAAQVVSGQVNQHKVLGPFLGVGQKLQFELFVLGLVLSAPNRSRDRMDRGAAADNANQTFGRSARNLEVAKVDVHQVRRRVYQAKAAVQFQGAHVAFKLDAARGNGLHDVARDDMLF